MPPRPRTPSTRYRPTIVPRGISILRCSGVRPGREPIRRAALQEHAADPDGVPVVEPPPAGEALPVHERPVPREPVVGDRPLVSDQLELRVRTRDLQVPRQPDEVVVAASDREPPDLAERR